MNLIELLFIIVCLWILYIGISFAFQDIREAEKELEEVKKLQTSISDNTFQLGQIMIQKYKIDSQIELLKKSLTDLENKEIELAKKLSDKYGKGHLNLDTGEFISNSSS